MNKLILSLLIFTSLSAFCADNSTQINIDAVCSKKAEKDLWKCYHKKARCYWTCREYGRSQYYMCRKNPKASMTFEEFQAAEAKKMHVATNFNT